MNVQEIVLGLSESLEEEFVNLLDELIAKKEKTRELGEGNRIPQLDRFITKEFEIAERGAKQVEQVHLRSDADRLFLEFIS